MAQFSFDSIGYRLNGEDAYLVSGEFHYFRVPRADWKRRMRLFIEAGGNCLATYVPWLIHEPNEGEIRFGDVDNRDLHGFLDLAAEMGLKVLLRPGPYQYSELNNSGLPEWLFDNYPEVMATDIDGEALCERSVSYLHPVFLEKARRYYTVFADQVRAYMADKGGPVVMLQVDNELTGVHLWYGSMDYNRETMGFGHENGRYATWLKDKYGTIEVLNNAYSTGYASFADAYPLKNADPSNIAACRRIQDYADFYRAGIAEYAVLLRSWLREDGLGGYICHNSANGPMNCLFEETVRAMGENFLLGSDHYYTLGQHWPQNNPTPQYAIRSFMSLEEMRAFGMPPTVLEMPGGSPADTPPILKEDLLACYLTNAALGMKGVNYYVYTGGPNFRGTGNTCDIYDYNAHIRADGAINPTYYALKEFGDYMTSHGWMQRAHRVASVQIGFEWSMLRADRFENRSDWSKVACTVSKVADFMETGIIYTLMCSKYSPEMVLLTGKLDTSRPLIVPCPSRLSDKAQQAVARFIEDGGKVLIMPTLPEYDEEGNASDALSRAIGKPVLKKYTYFQRPVRVEGIGNVYGIENRVACEQLPDGAQILATDVKTGKVLGYEQSIGKGRVIWFGGTWIMNTFPQAEMLEMFMGKLGAKPCVESENRNIFTSLWSDDEGRRTLFAMNLYSAPQSTVLRVDDKSFALDMKAMEVRVIDL